MTSDETDNAAASLLHSEHSRTALEVEYHAWLDARLETLHEEPDWNQDDLAASDDEAVDLLRAIAKALGWES